MPKEYFYKLECETDPTNARWRSKGWGYRFEPYEGIYTRNPITDMMCMFKDTDLTEIDARSWDLSNVTNMVGMFYYATNLISANLPETSKVTDMSGMFEGATNLTRVSLLDTSNVTNMSFMFNGDTSLTNVNLSDTSNVSHIGFMFCGATNFDQDIHDWDVSNVNSFTNMFKGATAMQEKFGVGDTPTKEWFNKGD